jgi:hypothetical protein
MPRSDHRDPKLERRWRILLARWKRSQQSIRRFCADQQISQASFYAWRREIAVRDRERANAASVPPSSPPPTFVPVRVIPDTPIEIVLPSGVIVRMPIAGDPVVVARLVTALGARP